MTEDDIQVLHYIFLLYKFLDVWLGSKYFPAYTEKRVSSWVKGSTFTYVHKQPPRGVLDFATLLRSHFVMGVLLQICCIFSEHLFVRIPLGGCFCVFSIKCLLSMSSVSICENCCIYYTIHGFCFLSKIIWYAYI